MPLLRTPDDIRADLDRRFSRQRIAWFNGEGIWPLRIPLGLPSAAEAENSLDLLPQWVRAWRQWDGPGTVEWVERRWRVVGTQTVPRALVIQTPDVAALLHEGESWRRAKQRAELLSSVWPKLHNGLGSLYAFLAQSNDADIHLSVSLLQWLESNPNSGLHPRQLPVEGLDSKWFESNQKAIADLFALIRDTQRTSSPAEFCGLLSDDVLIRTRVLDDALRRRLGGLGTFAAPATEIAKLDFAVQQVFIVENLQPGLKFGEVHGSVVFMGLGYALEQLEEIEWLRGVRLFYWGDIDTHGFAMLSKARGKWPHAESVLMDEQTLTLHKTYWGFEDQHHGGDTLPNLSEAEQQLYTALKTNRWRTGLRLEQERIPWSYVWERLKAAVGNT